MTTCRQLLRTGQLMLNQGTWLNAQGQPFPLVSADFMCDTYARLARDTCVVCVCKDQKLNVTHAKPNHDLIMIRYGCYMCMCVHACMLSLTHS